MLPTSLNLVLHKCGQLLTSILILLLLDVVFGAPLVDP